MVCVGKAKPGPARSTTLISARRYAKTSMSTEYAFSLSRRTRVVAASARGSAASSERQPSKDGLNLGRGRLEGEAEGVAEQELVPAAEVLDLGRHHHSVRNRDDTPLDRADAGRRTQQTLRAESLPVIQVLLPVELENLAREALALHELSL